MQSDATCSCPTSQCLLRQGRSNTVYGRRPSEQVPSSPEARRFKSLSREWLAHNERFPHQELLLSSSILFRTRFRFGHLINNRVPKIITIHPIQEEALANQVPHQPVSIITSWMFSKNERRLSAIEDDDAVTWLHPMWPETQKASSSIENDAILM
jgi:hypothetical protein